METGRGVRAWKRVSDGERRGARVQRANRMWRMALQGRRRLPKAMLRLIYEDWQRGVYTPSERNGEQR